MIRTTLFLTVLVLAIGILVGIVFLQIKLSGKPNRWLGIIPSAVIVSFSLLIMLFVVPFTEMTSTSDGFVVMYSKETLWSTAFHLLAVIFTINWPVIPLMVIHLIVRSGRSKKSEIEKMNIQDL